MVEWIVLHHFDTISLLETVQIKNKDHFKTYFKPSIDRSIWMVYCKSSRQTDKKLIARQSYQQYTLMRIMLCETHWFLWAWLEGRHIRYLGLTHNYLRDQTLNVKIDNLDRDKVLVGDVDEILEDETHIWSGATNTPFYH